MLKGRKPWRKEVQPSDAMVAERMVEILDEADALPKSMEGLSAPVDG